LNVGFPNFEQETISEIKENASNQDSINFHKTESIKFAESGEIEQANVHLKKYIQASGDLTFVNQQEFITLEDSIEYQDILKTYIPKFNTWVIFLLFSSIIGIFIAIILNLQKNRNKSANLLIALFVLFHSILIADFGFYFSNYSYQLPHSLFLSTTFSLLYGPLLYFYFKKTVSNYKFKTVDLLHLMPSLVLLVYILPFYLLTTNEKLHLLLNFEKYLVTGGSYIVLSKVVSLGTYAMLIFRISRRSSRNLSVTPQYQDWLKKVSWFFFVYVISYIVYGLSIMDIIDIPYIVHTQVAILASLVLYIAYCAFTKPMVFLSTTADIATEHVKTISIYSNQNSDITSEKYQKSRLTLNFSLELKENLLELLIRDKIYKENNLTLELLAQKLQTNRHNASQVINEHFNMSFFELINQYRIKEAKDLLENDLHKNMKIIDVAYEVGYNNKVTFNKSFKKETSLTPTQYQDYYKQKAKTRKLDPFASETNLFSGSGS